MIVRVNVPGWVNGHLLGDYGSSPTSAFFNGVLHLNKYKSILNTSVSTEGNQTLCKAILELPSIKQKVDLEIATVSAGPQNLGGSILLKVNDQEFQISGNLKSKVFESTRGERYIERLLQLTGNFSSIEITNTGLQLFIQKPVGTYSSLNIIGTLNVNDQTSTVSGGYELPNENTTSAGLFLKLQSSLLPSEESYEFFLKSFGNGLKKVEGKLNFKLTRFDILWDFVMPTSVLSVGLTGRSDGGDRIFFQVESIFNPNEIVQLSLNCHCSDTDYTFRTTLTRSDTAVVGHLYVDAPPLFDSTNEYKISVTKNTDGSYTMEASAVRGRLVLELAGDASLSPNNVSVVLKAMGSYGSHYADVTGSRNEDGFAVEVTVESSSLLVDKRVNVRGTLGIADGTINANIQCRARRNIHELSISLSRGEGRGGKLVVNLESPTFDPAKLEAEWDSREKYYFGQLKIIAWKKAHQSEFGINLEDFEGKLHIISPLLPSNEFNFHVKSIVNSENFDVLGDVRIRGSHWRLEGIASFFSLRNMTFKIETRTPFEFLDRITLGIKSTSEEIYLEIHTPASYVPNVMFKLGGIDGLQQGIWHQLKPNLIVALPNGKYSAEASLELPMYAKTGLVHILLQYIGKESKTFEIRSEISPLKTFKLQMENPGHIQLSLVTPFGILPRAGLHIEGEINSKRSGKLLITGLLNTYDGKFDASFDNSNGNMQAATMLVTNVPGYEKSAFAIAIEAFQGIGNGKSFHVEFRKPDWENLFRLDADYRYIFESMTELEGEINVNMDSYMNLPSLHAHLKSGMKNSRYTGIIEGIFGVHHPSLKVETKKVDEKITVIVEGKAGANDSYVLTNALEIIPFQNNFSFKEKLQWNGWQVLGMEASLSDYDELFEGSVHLVTPWGPIDSAVALTPITMLTMSQDLSLSQLLRNTNITVGVRFKERKLVGLELVSKDGMRLFEIQNPIRPVSLSLGVEKIGWNALRVKAGICWDLKLPEKASIGINTYMYRRSTGLEMGFYLAGADYGIVIANFEHYLISSKLKQNLKIQWNAHSGKMGDIGYTLNLTDKSTGLKRQMDYEFTLVAPSRSILIYGGSTSQDKNRVTTMAVAWDAIRDPEKILSFNVSSSRSTTWRTGIEQHAIEIQHFTWSEPMIFSAEKQLIHDSIRHFEITVKPSSNPSEQLSASSSWDNGDWTSLVVAVLQPATKVDIQAKYNVTEQYKLLKFNYMLFNGDSKMAAVILDRSTESQMLLVQSGDLAKPRTVVSVVTEASSFGHSVKGEILKYQIVGNVRTSLPYLDLTLRHDNVNKIHVVCGLPHPKEIVLKATRSQLRKTIQDVSVLLRLNSSSLLSTRIHWRPEVFDEIQDYDWLKGSKSLIQDLLPSFLEVSTAVRTEIDGHWNLLSPPVKQFMSSLYQISAYEINLIWEEAQVIGLRLQKLYSDNAFYIKDMVNIIRTSLSPLLRIFEKISIRAKQLCKTACYYLMNTGKIVSNAILKYYGRLEELVINTWDELDEIVIRFWRNNAERIETLLEELEEWVDSVIEALEGRIEMLESKLLAVGFIKNLISIYRDYATWMDELPIDDYVTAIEEFFQIKVWERLEEIFGPYLEAVRNALDDEYLKELLETPPIPYIRFVLKQTKNAFVRLWEVIELEAKAKNLVRHALKNIDGIMQRNFPTWELEWDLDRGIIQYDQSLSFIHWVDFTQSPQWRVNAQEEQEVNQITNFYYQILDYIENLKPVFDMRIRDILPPFGGLAMMAGDYHYYTFDKKYFRFAGECSYVLVADLLHNGFSFIVNYQSRDGAIRKKSYSIALKNHNIEFDAETFKVTVDSRKVELPVKVGTVYIRRQETRLDVYDTRGYQITCTLSPSVCTFSTSGWYYGKLAGLLGTYDNEPINDFRSPDGQIISDVPTFAYSWRVGKHRNQCRMKNFAKEEAEFTDVDNICYDLLANRASPLRPCFNTVDTTIFMEMCKYDISKNINNANRAESACTSMSAYVTECQKHNIDVWMPPTCVRCKLEDGTAFTTGENVTLEANGSKRPPSSSDIVILLEEKECVDQIDLANAIAKLEGSLRAEGIVDNRYAVIGFGGQGIHYDAHIQTSSASVWSHSTLFRAPDSTNITGVRKSDLYSAIHFASTMTYRAGVSKTLIAITCGDEKCGDSVRYSDTLTLLVENDFKLHMLTPKPLLLKGKKRQDETNRIFGFDTNGVYTIQQAKRGPLVADPSYKRQLNLPKDLCTPLAVETNGTRFSTENVSKKMLDVWSRRVAQTAHPSECQRCECVPDKNGGSRLMCHQCVSPSLWKFMEEWRNYQSQEIDDVFGLDMLETEPFLIAPN
ncbi:Apolipophorin [Orchesella cincta]|uniref:Apolipophorin n=1 Tax=Orchesella cincta TaxID=48709 RepID=A0A1D2NJ23_ORCCI|nr:Apolipophorin [Orchesella cincta]